MSRRMETLGLDLISAVSERLPPRHQAVLLVLDEDGNSIACASTYQTAESARSLVAKWILAKALDERGSDKRG